MTSTTFVGGNGTIGAGRPLLRKVTDFFQSIIDMIALFFKALTAQPQTIEIRPRAYNQRNNTYRSGGRSGYSDRPRRSNIHGMSSLRQSGACDTGGGG